MSARMLVPVLPILAFALLLAGAAWCMPSPGAGASSPTLPARGDLNCDGVIDIADVSELLSYVGIGAGASPGSSCTSVSLGVTGDPVFGDIDCNGRIDRLDILHLLRHVALIDGKGGPEFPCSPLSDPIPPEPSAYMLVIRRSGSTTFCVQQDQQLLLEVYIQGVPGSRPLRSFSFDLNINPGGLRIDSIDYEQLLASGSSGPLVSTSDATPATATTFHVGVEDQSDNAESGSGILLLLSTTVTGSAGFSIDLANVSLIDGSGTALPILVTAGSGFAFAQPGTPCSLPSTGGRP